MSTYKVPQDVEAEDKLLGPFTFRQFIYLIIVAVAIAIAWGLAQILLPLAILPLPIILFFGALALPLRKDQPMEIYLAAVVSYFLRPKKRLWQADGVESPIEITVPKIPEVQLSKDISPTEAVERLGFLANVIDSEGWSIRGPGSRPPSVAMSGDIYAEASNVVDMFDPQTTLSTNIDNMMDKQDTEHRRLLMEQFRQQASMPLTDNAGYLQQEVPVATSEYNPYPTEINQAVPQPIDPNYQYQNTSEQQVSPAIINIATNSDLSVETLAREANRVNQGGLEDEVIVSLR